MDYTSAIPGANGRANEGGTNVFKRTAPGGAGDIDAFDAAEAAPEFAPLPPGVYSARALRGEYCSTRAGAEAYRLRFEITGGDHVGKTVIRTWTFGAKALPYTKRDLSPFGLTSSAQLLSPFPPAGREYLVRLVVALRRGNDGIDRNDIKRIGLLRIVDSPAASFMPDRGGEGGTQ